MPEFWGKCSSGKELKQYREGKEKTKDVPHHRGRTLPVHHSTRLSFILGHRVGFLNPKLLIMD